MKTDLDVLNRKVTQEGTVLSKARDLAERYYDTKMLKQLDELADSVQEALLFEPPEVLQREWQRRGLEVEEEKMKIQNEMAQTAAAVSYLHGIDVPIHDLVKVSPKVARGVRQYQQNCSSLEVDTLRAELDKRHQLQLALLQQKSSQR